MEKMNAKTLGSVTLCSAVFLARRLRGPDAAQSSQRSGRQQDATVRHVAALKAQLAEQQKEIDQLKLALGGPEESSIERATRAPRRLQAGQDSFALPEDKALGEVASATPIIPSIAPAAAPTLARRRKPPAEATPARAARHECCSAVSASRQRLHCSDRVPRCHLRMARANAAIRRSAAIRKRSLQQHRQLEIDGKPV